MTKWMIAAGIAVGLSAGVMAQGGRQASPDGTAAAQVAGHWVDILYGRPLKRGRDLWGSGADYGKTLNDGAPVWRAGANVSTRLKNEATLTIGGKTVPPGEYTMFVDLKPNAWTFILSRWAASPTFPGTKDALFGAFEYTPAKDVVRVPMKLETLPYSVEELTWSFADVTGTGGRMVLTWDRMMASMPFTVAK